MNASGRSRLPDFVIIGAQKSASTFIQDALSRHPAIYLPGHETRFFEDPEYGNGNIADLRKIFDGRAEQAVGIKRPDYLGRAEVPARIRRHVPDAKIIAVLRNPIDRLVSAYYYYIKLGFLPAVDINDAIPELLSGRVLGNCKANDLLGYGRYATHLQRYRELFPDEQMHILFQDDISADPAGEIAHVCRFLGVPSGPPISLPAAANAGVYSLKRLRFLSLRNRFLYDYDDASGKLREKRMNVVRLTSAAAITLTDRWFLARLYGNPRPQLHESIRSRLQDYYKGEIDRIAQMTGKDLGSWG